MKQEQDLCARGMEAIKGKLGRAQFNMWFANARMDRKDDGHVVVEVQNGFQADWIRSNYLSLVKNVLKEIASSEMEVEISLTKSPRKAESAPDTTFPAGKKFDDRVTWNYTFDNFVVGSSNQFAHATAQAVAAEPGRKYNPLLIYGGVGLGKTHLIHAIANHLGNGKNLLLHSMTSQNFEHEMISHLRAGSLDQFRAKYRAVDVLLIDDVHFWSGKERTQQEFYFVFNTLFESRRQMVFTSDRPPSEIPDLDERLISRFGMGLIADIQPPDIETKVAILQKKAELFHVPLTDELAFYLAGRITSNVRDLEGCLMRLAAHKAFSHEDMSIEYIKANIEAILPGRKEKPSVDEILRTVSHEFSLKISDLKGERRIKSIAYGRQISMFLLRTVLEMSFPEIGSLFGGKDHSTVIHACRKIERMSSTDDRTKQVLYRLKKSIGYA